MVVGRSDDAAPGPHDLAVDPVLGRAGEEGDDLGDVFRGAEPPEGWLGGEAGDGLHPPVFPAFDFALTSGRAA